MIRQSHTVRCHRSYKLKCNQRPLVAIHIGTWLLFLLYLLLLRPAVVVGQLSSLDTSRTPPVPIQQHKLWYGSRQRRNKRRRCCCCFGGRCQNTLVLLKKTEITIVQNVFHYFHSDCISQCSHPMCFWQP